MKDRIFLHGKIFVQKLNEKPRKILDQSGPMFHNLYLGGGLLISVCLPDVDQRAKGPIFRAKPDENFPNG